MIILIVGHDHASGLRALAELANVSECEIVATEQQTGFSQPEEFVISPLPVFKEEVYIPLFPLGRAAQRRRTRNHCLYEMPLHHRSHCRKGSDSLLRRNGTPRNRELHLPGNGQRTNPRRRAPRGQRVKGRNT